MGFRSERIISSMINTPRRSGNSLEETPGDRIDVSVPE
jgi:hypothetical protein